VLSIAPIFSHGRTEAGIRWLFIATGVLGVLGTVGFAIDNTALGLGTLLSVVLFFLATLLFIACSGVHGSRVTAPRVKQLGETRPRCYTRRVNQLSIKKIRREGVHLGVLARRIDATEKRQSGTMRPSQTPPQ